MSVVAPCGVPPALPRAALFCRTFLPPSETFIHDELTHHTRWAVDVFCRRRIHEQRFPYPSVHTPGGTLAALVYRATTYSPSFERRLREGGHRLLHAHFGTSAVYALTYQSRLRLPMAVTFHGYDVGALVGRGHLAPKLWRYWARSRAVLDRADVILCPSAEFQQILGDLSGRPEATRLLHLGIDLERFRRATRPPGPLRVAMVGRFVEKKGFVDGIEAFAAATRRGIDARLVIAGDGPLRRVYRRRIEQLGLGERVDMPGLLAPPQIAALLAGVDVLVAPSRTASNGDRESGVIVVKEASASSVPVVATRHGGIPEIVDDGITGYLVDEGDVGALADRLVTLLGDADLRARCGDAGRRKMEAEYDIRRSVAELERIYDAIAR